ncbi:MAG: thiolase domain-containing protein [SAR202 cluster bacterium]|jgi:acetyl-CoA C-acetyltransferase|nr:thiolase domain-containing protein [SAR202 cluster bacterium]MDP6300478.1 thiolase domain-containing protein [SAR202 cluster bacterium]MDP7102099.1 thiolase domain-containing protein [SAR202 cluster bacterium]MDP7224110.1 thiolase domain-containing protein [SAR202 cluster bacterium]MDP7412320.1 thiolase domain-containing protein [SAR202 cluster bacterium]|tara:strand:- start:2114 stop:3307 length:1194 start_codon:yes stop_codon:yes gene_type:complete
MPQRREAAIVGVHEYPLRVVGQDTSALQIKAASAKAALDDAGLSWSDVDAVYDTGSHQGIGGLGISEYLGIKPKVIDSTSVGGTSYEFHANHAAMMIAAGKCEVALLTYGSTAHSDRRAIGTGGFTGTATPNPQTNMEAPWGLTLISNYGLVKQRHMHQYGTTNEQFAAISVATRKHAMRNPEAVKAMTDLEFVGINELSIEDVVDSRMVAWPLRLLECCMISDGGGAVVIASPKVAANAAKKPVWIIGTGEATQYRENGGDITKSAGAQSGPRAFADAGVSPSEVDVLMAYDSFSITVMCMIEDLGFCAKGEGGAYVEDGHLAFDHPTGPALNTDGGGLSSNHPGERGIFLLLEATRQLRGESTSQVNDPKLAVAVGNGGQLGSRHATGVTILAAD